MTFDPPGFAQDLDQAGRDAWSALISGDLNAARARGTQPGDASKSGPRLQFFNPDVTPPGPDAVAKDISWSAFPRVVQINSMTDRQRWRTADSSRDFQDEYCEWSVTRDPQTDTITRVTFTSEPPEYWNFLASVDQAKVLELYQRHISPQVKMTDLFHQGGYRPVNKWNNSTSNGAMHLIQGSNSLYAEIELAASATIVRKVGGQVVTDPQELIRCGRYGEPERHSDPFIGASVNELARAKADITLQNPVGLYLAELSVAGWVTPDGSDPLSYWTIERGTKEKTLRAAYEVPAAKGFAVGNIKIGGRPIEFGAQIADFIRVKLTGVATRIGQSTVQPFDGCVGSAGLVASRVVRSLADLLPNPVGREAR